MQVFHSVTLFVELENKRVQSVFGADEGLPGFRYRE